MATGTDAATTSRIAANTSTSLNIAGITAITAIDVTMETDTVIGRATNMVTGTAITTGNTAVITVTSMLRTNAMGTATTTAATTIGTIDIIHAIGVISI